MNIPTAKLTQVKASAGAGKTFELTSRFLRLLGGSVSGPTPPSCGDVAPGEYGWAEIMAVTFTNKAAAEMKERVVSSLKERALGDANGPAKEFQEQEAAQWVDRILRNYHQLNIRTIDSLITLIMRIFALEAGLAPDFETIFSIGDLYEELWAGLVELAENGDEEAQRLITDAQDAMLHFENRPGFTPGALFHDRLQEILAFRLTNTQEFQTDPAVLNQALSQLLQNLRDAATALSKSADGMAVNANLKKYIAYIQQELTINTHPKDSKLMEKDSFEDCVNKNSKQDVTADHELAYRSLQEAFVTYRTEGKILRNARDFAPFIPLADRLKTMVLDLIISRNVLLNSLAPGLAHALLERAGGVPDAFCRMGARLGHMLIDEFQDTSRDQWDAMLPLAQECLSKAGGMFLVGDVKQAIYGWRGGDARLFDEVPQHEALTAVAEVTRGTLPNNWRSHKHIVEFNNTIFGTLGTPERAMETARSLLPGASMDVVDELAYSIEGAYRDSEQELPPHKRDTAGFVRLTHIHAEKREDMDAKVHEELSVLFDSLLARRTPGEIAVLVRKNSEAGLVAGWLLHKGIPVITENSLSLGAHPVIRQIAAFLRFLDYPLDDLSLWEFISGEEIFLCRTGQSKEQMTRWVAGLQNAPLFPRFLESFPEISARYISRYLKRAGFMTPYDMASEIIEDFRIVENNPDAKPYVRRFLEVIHAAEASGRQSLAAFLEYWYANGGEEKVPLPENVDAIRIMTIHQSKGLQFPVVVIPFHSWTGKAHSVPTPFDYNGTPLLVPLCKEMGDIYWDAAARDMLEQLDLLYVAWTRPEEELHCLLTHCKSLPGAKAFEAGLGVILEDTDFDDDTAEIGTPPKGSAEEHGSAPDAATCPAQDNEDAIAPGEDLAPPMNWLPRLKIHRHFAQESPLDSLLPGSREFDAKARGTLIHDALDRLRRTGLNPYDAAKAAAAHHADVMPADEPAREGILSQTAQCIEWAMSLPNFPDWIERGFPECPILDAEGDEHRPDLLVMDTNETIVVEYKTGQPDPAHEEQVHRYMTLLQGMQGASPNMRAVILYLDLKQTKEVRP